MDQVGSGDAAPETRTPGGGAVASVYKPLLRNRSFRNLMLATFTSAMGDWIGFLAIIALTSQIMGPGRAAAFAVSGVMMARVLPSLLIGPVAGVFVDRWDRKRVMIITHLGRGTVMALIPFTNEVFTLVLATLIIEAMSALFAPAKDSILPGLVEARRLVAANQMNLLTTYGTLPLGAAMYSMLVLLAAAIAPEGSFLAERPLALPIWFNALTFFASAPLLMTLSFPRASARKPRKHRDPLSAEGPWEQLKNGFRFIGTQPVIRSFIVGVMVAAAAAGVVITTGEFFAQVLDAGTFGYGVLVAIVGVGLVGGLVAAEPITRRVRPERLFAPGIGAAGAALMLTALMPTLLATVPFALIMGGGAGVCFIVGYTVLQTRADDHIRGRTFGAFNSGIRLAIFGSAVAVPAVIGVIGREIPVDEGRYTGFLPYALGGVRLTLFAAGLLAVVGAVLVGRTLAGALAAEDRDAEQLPLEPEEKASLLARNGSFVVFEGGDGSGKSTQIRLLRSAIERTGRKVVVTREPGGTPLGERLREVLLSRAHEGMDVRTEALLYAAARAQHIDEVILPALERGEVVLSDRFVDSSIAYQGAGRELGEERVGQLNRWATRAVEPDLTVLLDLDADDGLERASGEEEPDRLESAGSEFHGRVREAYLRRSEVAPERYLVLDASRPVEELHAEIRARVLSMFAPADPTPVDEAQERVAPGLRPHV
jgi:dTMP kinase